MGDCRLHREALARRLPDGLILLSGGAPVPRNNDVYHVFRQASNFLYLTGVEEPHCHLLIDPRRRRQILFVPRVDTSHRVWEGDVPGPAQAARRYGFARVLTADRLSAEVERSRRGYRTVYADAGAARRLRVGLDGLKVATAPLLDALEELRSVKTTGELELLRRASAVSGLAHREVMRRARPGMKEYQVQAVFDALCLDSGLRHLGYPTIVAAGINGAVLHYRRNDAELRAGDLILVDGGAEAGGYSADITRTFPVNGRFTRRQRDIYEIVLEAQLSSMGRARPGITSAELHVHSMAMIARGLKDLGFLRGSVDGLVEGGAVRLFYPHGLTHMLGLDVHDGTGGRRRRLANPTKVPVRFVARLEPGFVLTMEPGIYFNRALLSDPALRRRHRASVNFDKARSYLGFGGVRIEDDVVIQPEGPPLNLTNVPKTVSAVEDACRR